MADEIEEQKDDTASAEDINGTSPLANQLRVNEILRKERDRALVMVQELDQKNRDLQRSHDLLVLGLRQEKRAIMQLPKADTFAPIDFPLYLSTVTDFVLDRFDKIEGLDVNEAIPTPSGPIALVELIRAQVIVSFTNEAIEMVSKGFMQQQAHQAHVAFWKNFAPVGADDDDDE